MKAMLADHTLDGGNEELLAKLKFPKLVLPKYDGVRIHTTKGRLVFRSGKVVPNRYLQRELMSLPHGLEGELLVNGSFADTTSAVRSHDKEGYSFTLQLFDDSSQQMVYQDRLLSLYTTIMDLPDPRIIVSDAKIVNNLDELLQLESEYVEFGMEGIIIRDPRSPYKQGRSTFNEQYYLSMKRYLTAEATVVGYRCKEEGGISVDTLGALDLQCNGVEFGCGSGLTDATRKILWAAKDELIGKTVEFKYQRSDQTAPRFPVFLRFR